MKRALILVFVLCSLVLVLLLVFARPDSQENSHAPELSTVARDTATQALQLDGGLSTSAPARGLAPSPERALGAAAPVAAGSPAAIDAEGRIAGRVLRPDGKPAPLARVQYLELPTNRPLDQAREDSAVSEADGSFRLVPVPGGRIRLVATHDDFAASAAQFLDFSAHEQRTGITLTLRGYGRVAGFVRDARNLAQPGRAVICSDQFLGKTLFEDSDGSGHFAFEQVNPGQYLVSVKLAESELSQMNAEAPFLAFQMESSDHQHWIEVKESETVELVLGGLPADGVRVFGRVSAGGKPLAAAWLWAIALDGKGILPLPHARTNERGEYELWVKAAGSFDIQLSAGGGATDLTRRVVVPARAEHKLDFELSSASLSGHVVDRAGRPVANQSVVLVYRGPLPGSVSPQIEARMPDVVTGEDGRFAFQHLQAGRYDLLVRGKQAPNSDESLAYGCVHTDEFALESGATIESVEIVLTPGCVLRGVVRGVPEGAPVNARIVVWDDKGRWITALRADPDGSFAIRGLPAGEVCAGASLSMQASPVSAPVRLSESKEGFVELELGGGANMHVRVKAAEGAPPVSYQVLIKDGRGNVVYDTYITHEDPDEPTWVQVLPVGTYTVEINGADDSHGLATACIEAGRTAQVEVLVRRAK